MSTATLTSKGQVTIPKDVREQAHLKSGVQLDFVVMPDGRIIIIPRTASVKDVKGILKPYAKRKKALSNSEIKKVCRKRAVQRMKK